MCCVLCAVRAEPASNKRLVRPRDINCLCVYVCVGVCACVYGNWREGKGGSKGKTVKYTLVHALGLCTGCTAHRGSWDTALLFLDHVTRRGEVSASLSARCLPPGKTRFPLYRRLGGPQGRSGQVPKISPPQGFNHQTVQPVASRYTDYATRPTMEVQAAQNYTVMGWWAAQSVSFGKQRYSDTVMGRRWLGHVAHVRQWRSTYRILRL